MSNFEEVVNKAMETGEQVVTIECPCCHKSFYATESEAAYQSPARDETDYQVDDGLKLKQLGRKCPYCGFTGALGANDLTVSTRDQFMKDAIKAEQDAFEHQEKNQTPWSKICNPMF